MSETSLVGYFDVCTQVAERARVPWIQAAKRIQKALPQVAYLRMMKNDVGDFVIKWSSFSDDAGRSTKIKQGSLGWKALNDELTVAHGRLSHRKELDLGLFKGTSFGDLVRRTELQQAFIEPAPKADLIKLVAAIHPGDDAP